MATWLWAKGEVGTTYTFTLQDAAGNAIDLTGKTVTLKYKPKEGGSTTSRTLTVTNAVGGVCTHTLVSGDTSTAGDFMYDFEISSSGYLDFVPKVPNMGSFSVVNVV